MMTMKRTFAALLALGLAVPAAAQTYPRPDPELPSDKEPVRKVPAKSYTLSLSWQPEYCHARTDHSAFGGCGNDATRLGFTLHGLWPDGDGFNRWPQYCKPVDILTDRQIKAGIGVTPSPQLLQHEWAKHGVCVSPDPVSYFQDETRLFKAIHVPDMASLAQRKDLTAIQFQQAFAAANPGMRANMMRLNVKKTGWLSEVWICLGLDKRPKACPASQGGAKPATRIRIQAPN
jgi:ribonuclease T2